MRSWTPQQIKNYYLGMKYGDYPNVFWEKMKPFIKNYTSVIDIGCGPGAFALKALEEGLEVWAVDVDKKHLDALEKTSEDRGLTKLKVLHGSWMHTPFMMKDICICAYSLGGEIGTLEGIKKVINATKKVAFFIVPYDSQVKDFSSEFLYKLFNIEPMSYSNDYKETLNLFHQLNEPIEYYTLTYDFGVPFDEKIGLKGNAMYLSEKLNLPYSKVIEKHIENIMIIKNKIKWIPNIKKSILIIWRRKES